MLVNRKDLKDPHAAAMWDSRGCVGDVLVNRKELTIHTRRRGVICDLQSGALFEERAFDRPPLI